MVLSHLPTAHSSCVCVIRGLEWYLSTELVWPCVLSLLRATAAEASHRAITLAGCAGRGRGA